MANVLNPSETYYCHVLDNPLRNHYNGNNSEFAYPLFQLIVVGATPVEAYCIYHSSSLPSPIAIAESKRITASHKDVIRLPYS